MDSARKLNTSSRWLLPLALVLIALICFALWYLRVLSLYNEPGYQQIDSTKGVWDLTDFDFENSFMRANGEVEYIPDALLSPEEFETREDEAIVGVTGDVHVSTARLRILVPEDGTYMMAMNSLDFSERIYINGVWQQDVGTPGLSAESSTPGFAFMYFEVQAQDGVIDIVRQSANFVHRTSSNSAGIVIGSPEKIQQHIALRTDLSAFSMGLFFSLFLVHGLLFLIFRSYRANLYVALLCLSWCIRVGATGTKVLTAWFPSLPWEVIFKLEYLTAPMAALLIILIIKQVFAGLLPVWFVRGSVVLFGAYGVFCLLCPTLPLSYTMLGFEVAFILAIVVVIVCMAIRLPRMIRAGDMQVEQWVLLCGLALFFFATIHDAFYYNNIYLFGIDYVLNDLSLMIFAFFQVTALLYATMRQVTEARQNERIAWESAELARRDQQLAQLEAENLRKSRELQKQLIASIPEESLAICGLLVLNIEDMRAYLDNIDLELTPKEFSLLLYFIRHENEPVSREDIYAHIWKAPLPEKDRALESHIYRLRKKLEGSDYAITVKRGSGYLFEKAL